MDVNVVNVGLPAIGAGLRAGPGAMRLLVASGSRRSRRALAYAPLGAVTAAASSTPPVALWEVAPWMAPAGAGIGLIFAPLYSAVLGGVPATEAGAASGLLNTAQQLGNALGVTPAIAWSLPRHSAR